MDKLVGFYKLFNYSLKYDWGSGVGIERFLGDEWVGFLNTDSSIYPVDETVNNHSEVWFGSYKHSAFYFEDGACKFLKDEPASRLDNVVVKLIDVASPLSIQVHPDMAEAKEGFKNNVDGYVDANHKPEMLHVLSDTFTLFLGVKPLADVLTMLETMTHYVKYDAKNRKLLKNLIIRVKNINNTNDGEESLNRRMKAFIMELIDSGNSGEYLTMSEKIVKKMSKTDKQMQIIHNIMLKHKHDPKALLCLLLNIKQYRKGETFYIPPKMIHSYVEGFGVEIITASDNTIRAGLTNKPVNMEEFFNIAKLTPETNNNETLATTTLNIYGEKTYQPVEEFTIMKTTPLNRKNITLSNPAIMVTLTDSEIGENGDTIIPTGSVYHIKNVNKITVKGETLIIC